MIPIFIALACIGSSFAAQEKSAFEPILFPFDYRPLYDLLRDADLESITCTITMSITIGCNFKRDGDQHFINFLGQDFPVGFPLAASKRADQEDISGTITIDFGKRSYVCGFPRSARIITPICRRK
ncbi:uncharacterized protein LOC131936227 [Physella acuta]|uniref:uncharacterized protein LOC131936227 n=1 Tax=Physella acuta TaxID=109671 RepID=UPI0027DE4643|nr:uncharacterized protein LOC131936227 [Physella acuta]